MDGPLTFDVGCSSNGQSWTNGPNAGKCVEPADDWNECGFTGATIPSSMFDEQEICSTGQASSCETSTYPQGNGMEDTDLVIYFTGNPDFDDGSSCTGVMGFAAYCHINSRNRPIAGYINLCKSTIDDRSVLTWEESLSLIIHETFHVLGIYISRVHLFRVYL